MSTGADVPVERATRVARVRSEVDVGIWVVIWLSLAFTAINVQIFAARGAEMWSLAWSAAWLLDPMVSILVLVVVRAEQITSRWRVRLGWPITATKWGCFAATYAMNTWSSWVEQSPSRIVLHSVPPAMMLLAAEVGPRIRDGLTRAVAAASEALPDGAVRDRSVAAGSSPVSPAPTGAAPDSGIVEVAEVAEAAGVAETLASGDRTAPHSTPPLPPSSRAHSPEPGCPPTGSGQGRVPDPVTVQVEPPTTETMTGSGPDRSDRVERPDRDGADSARTMPAAASPPRSGSAGGHDLIGAASAVDRQTGSADVTGPGASDVGAGSGAAGVDADGGDGRADSRVRLLRELLDGGCAVTGAQAATLLSHVHGATSDRTGRRLLAEARQTRSTQAGSPASSTPQDSSTTSTDPEERASTGTDGCAGPAPLSLVPRPSQDSPGELS